MMMTTCHSLQIEIRLVQTSQGEQEAKVLRLRALLLEAAMRLTREEAASKESATGEDVR